MQRGIITSPLAVGLGSEGFSLTSSLTPEDIRFYALYWDKVIIPTNFLMHVSLPDEEMLISSEIITRPMLQLQGSFKGNEFGKAVLEGHCALARDRMKDPDVDWIYHQIGTQLYLPEELSSIGNVIRVELSGALPVPGKDVSIHELLEFKERRSDELGALHNAMDEIYFDVLRSPDQGLTTKKAFHQLQAEVANLNKASKESFPTSRKFDLSAELNLNGKDVAVAAAGGALIDSLATGFTLPLATAVAAVASLLKVSVKATRTLNHAESKTKLSYLSNAVKESII